MYWNTFGLLLVLGAALSASADEALTYLVPQLEVKLAKGGTQVTEDLNILKAALSTSVVFAMAQHGFKVSVVLPQQGIFRGIFDFKTAPECVQAFESLATSALIDNGETQGTASTLASRLTYGIGLDSFVDSTVCEGNLKARHFTNAGMVIPFKTDDVLRDIQTIAAAQTVQTAQLLRKASFFITEADPAAGLVRGYLNTSNAEQTAVKMTELQTLPSVMNATLIGK